MQEMSFRSSYLTPQENPMIIKKSVTLALATAILVAVSGDSIASGDVVANPNGLQGKHFDPKGNLPSKFTIELRKGVPATLPFEDKRDFDEAKKGFINAVLDRMKCVPCRPKCGSTSRVSA
jgi:hypothetical protein